MNAFWWSGNGFGIGFLSIRIELRDQNDVQKYTFLMVWNQFWDRVLMIRIELRDQNDVQSRADRQTDPQLLRAVKSSSQPGTLSPRAGRALGHSFMY